MWGTHFVLIAEKSRSFAALRMTAFMLHHGGEVHLSSEALKKQDDSVIDELTTPQFHIESYRVTPLP
jgi:hypothetical protein